MFEIYYFMKKITLIIMEGAQFDQSSMGEINVLCEKRDNNILLLYIFKVVFYVAMWLAGLAIHLS